MYANDTAYTDGSIANVESYINEILGNDKGSTQEPEQPEEPVITTIEETLEEGDYVYFTDGTGTQRTCVVLYGPENANYENYGIQIITMETVEEITIGALDKNIQAAREAYNGGIATINSAVNKYLNPIYASSVRSVGSIPDNPTYDGAGYFTLNDDDNTSDFFTPYNGTFRDGDDNYLTDWEQLNALTIQTISDSYYLASREVEPQFGAVYFRMRYVRTTGKLGNNDIVLWTYRDTDNYTDQLSEGLRPVFTLIAGLKVTGGSGEENAPYTLGV